MLHGRGMDRHGHRLRPDPARAVARLTPWQHDAGQHERPALQCAGQARSYRSRLRKGRRWVLDRIIRRTHSRGLGRRGSQTGWPGRGGRRHGQTLSNTGGLHLQQVLKHASAKCRRHCVEERRDGAVVDVLSEQGVAALHDLRAEAGEAENLALRQKLRNAHNLAAKAWQTGSMRSGLADFYDRSCRAQCHARPKA